MTRRSRYSPEVKERAVRMVFDQQAQHESQWSAISSIASKIDCTRETLRTWVRRAERDAGKRAGLTTDERQRLKELERENRELKRANEILLKASAFFAPRRRVYPHVGFSCATCTMSSRMSFAVKAWRAGPRRPVGPGRRAP